MNREILFKAKRIDWRTLPKEEWWVKGLLTIIQICWRWSDEEDHRRNY